jgi:two-component system, OmpR family, KDP operon response regulator KdpE
MPAPRVLVVDDEAHIRAFIRDALGMCGYIADVAANGVQALMLFDQHSYDLLVLDLRMPEMGGWEVLDAITRRRPTRAVIISGFVTPFDEERARQLGVALLRKPFTVADFKRLVQEGVAGRSGETPRKPLAKSGEEDVTNEREVRDDSASA